MYGPFGQVFVDCVERCYMEKYSFLALHNRGYAVAQLVESLRFKPEGRGFDSRWCPGRTVALKLIQPLTEMSTRNISWDVKAVGAQG
jgi:hypothetical protein